MTHDGLMRLRFACINDLPIKESNRSVSESQMKVC